MHVRIGFGARTFDLANSLTITESATSSDFLKERGYLNGLVRKKALVQSFFS